MEIKSKNKDYKQYVLDKLGSNHFSKHVDFNITKIEEGIIEAETDFQTYMQQQDGYVHGGITSAFADMACGFAAYSLVEAGQRVMTQRVFERVRRVELELEVEPTHLVDPPANRTTV